MSPRGNKECQVQGTVSPGFESVKDLYEIEMRSMAEEHTQLCVYHKGERVVDLWATATDDPKFTADSIVNVFSSGKSLEAIAMAWLVGKGLLDYKSKIVDYWPEFGSAGKEEITVADLMRHEGGLAAFNTSIDVDDLIPEKIKENRIGKIIEGHPARFRSGNGGRREYHAVTRGWIANEVFRRVDPEGRTMGQFLREEISGPLDVDAMIGVKEGDLGRISPISPLGIGFQLLESFKPKFLGRRIKHNIIQILGRIVALIPSLRTSSTRGAPPPFKGMTQIDFFNQRGVAMGETPSAASNCSARGLAKIAAMMSARGKWGERAFLTEAAWRAMHDDAIEADIGFGMTSFTQGGVNAFKSVDANSNRIERAFNVGREGFFGWMGLGGSLFQWNPEHEIGFGYVPTSLHVLDLMNERGKVFQAEVLRCVENMKD